MLHLIRLWLPTLISAAVVLVPLGCLLRLLLAKPLAIRDGLKDVDLFWGFVRLHLWEQNEGLVFLKNKKISQLVYGPEPGVGGGSVFIFPLFAEELRIRVPLTKRLSVFVDENILTQESARVRAKVAFWWQVKDLEKYFYFLDENVHRLRDEDVEATALGGTKSIYGFQSQEERQFGAAERWIQTLVEASLRNLVSSATVAMLVSRTPSTYLRGEGTKLPDEPSNVPGTVIAPVRSSSSVGFTEILAVQLLEVVAPKAEGYGLTVERFEIQEIRLAETYQQAVDDVWVSSLAPAKAEREGTARQIKLQKDIEVLGKEAVIVSEVLKSLPSNSFLGSVPPVFNHLIGSIVANSAQTSASLPSPTAPVSSNAPQLPDGQGAVPAPANAAVGPLPVFRLVKCPGCGQPYLPGPEFAGESIPCPQCKTMISIPK